MSTVQINPTTTGRYPAFAATWLPLLLGLAAMYFPVYRDLALNTWTQDAHAHGPLILIMSIFLTWQRRHVFGDAFSSRPVAAGWLLLLPGLLIYALGRSQDVNLLAVAAQIPIFSGIVLITRGAAATRVLLFPLLFLAFMIPLPGFLVDGLTGPLKLQVSAAAEQVIYLLGYPVARSGVTLTVGNYQLLVADACSGLHSMFSLSAVGLLYIFLMRHRNGLRNGLLIASILPIAFAANCTRIVALSLVTYHFGEAAGQGLVHELASPTLFILAILFMAGLDVLLGRLPPCRDRDAAVPPVAAKPQPLPLAKPRTLVLALSLACSIGLAFAFTPRIKVADLGPKVNLETMIPKKVDAWAADDAVPPLRADPGTQSLLDSLYNQILSRTYVNAQGHRVMLLIAYGGDESHSMQVHKPEVCYPSQGFQLAQENAGSLDTGRGLIPVHRLVAVQGSRVEPVTYWMTIGDKIAEGGGGAWKLEQMKYGLTGKIPDGLLFRLSSITADGVTAYQDQQAFTQALVKALPQADRARFIGRPGS